MAARGCAIWNRYSGTSAPVRSAEEAECPGEVSRAGPYLARPVAGDRIGHTCTTTSAKMAAMAVRPRKSAKAAPAPEAAAMAAGRWVGRGNKNGGDGAAVDAMRKLIGTVSMRGVVVIGEGEKDNAPMLFNGEEVGDGTGPLCDVAVDPIDGTTLMSKGMPSALAVIAVAERGTMFDPSAVFYMEKIATGVEAADVIDITAPPAENVRRVAK